MVSSCLSQWTIWFQLLKRASTNSLIHFVRWRPIPGSVTPRMLRIRERGDPGLVHHLKLQKLNSLRASLISTPHLVPRWRGRHTHERSLHLPVPAATEFGAGEFVAPRVWGHEFNGYFALPRDLDIDLQVAYRKPVHAVSGK